MPQVPAVPTGLAASAGQTDVSLSWNAVSGATGYDIYRGMSSGGESFDTSVTGTSYNDTAVTAGSTYYYRSAPSTRPAGAALSGEVSARVPRVPAVPTGLGASAGQTNVSLTWNAVSGATGYDIYRGTSSGGETLDTSVTGTSYNDTAVSACTAYYYEVTAVSRAARRRSGEVSATPGNDWFSSNLPDARTAVPGPDRFQSRRVHYLRRHAGAHHPGDHRDGPGTVSAAVVASLQKLASSSGAAYLHMSASVEGLIYNLADGGQYLLSGDDAGPTHREHDDGRPVAGP